MKTIGVFDSGVGGESVANALKSALPDCQVIYKDDKDNVPYGNKSKELLLKLVKPIIKDLAKECDLVVIACNTVSTTIINELRESVDVPLIAVEPMVAAATAKSTNKKIAVFATPTTLASKRYAQLVSENAKHIDVLEPDCSTWSYMIQNNKVDEAVIRSVTEDVCRRGADVIVLGCTHYHWIEDLIEKESSGRAVIIQPEDYIIEQVKQVLSQLG